MNIAVFPGSFDPITIGHVEIVKRALPIFDQVIIAIGINNSKQNLFALEQRLEWINAVFADEPKVTTATFYGLTVDFCKSVNARFLLRGLRNAADFDYEKTISQLNHVLGEDLETIFLISRPKYSHISSTIVKEIIRVKGDASAFLPREVDLKNYKL
jgi:pantetheine-phosphate adenylyltransferase